MPTLAIIGAGPGMGLAIARTFGSRGFDVALIARTREAGNTGRPARPGRHQGRRVPRGCPRPCLTDGCPGRREDPLRRHRRTGVLADPHSPVPGFTMAAPSEVTVENLQPQVEYSFYGAVAAAKAVLPAMREASAGTLLFTTGGGSVDPVPMLGNVNAAQAALRNWVLNLNKELTGSGVFAARVAINVWIGGGGPEGSPTATPEQIAPLYWDLHHNRDRPEAVFNA